MAYGENVSQPPYYRATKPSTGPTAVGNDDRQEVWRCVMLTPIGLEAKEAYQRLQSRWHVKLQFRIEDKNDAAFFRNDQGPLAGVTDPEPRDADFPDKLIVNIMAIQTSKGNERMKQWSREERIHIIAVHERHHVRRNGSVDETPPDIHDEPERSIVVKELQARFEYSILYPDASAEKNTWLPNYTEYFAPKNRKKEDPVLDAYLDALDDVHDAKSLPKRARKLTQEEYDKAKESAKQKNYDLLVK